MPEEVDLWTATKESVLLGFELIGETIATSPELVEKIALKLQPQVESDLRKYVEGEGKKVLLGQEIRKTYTEDEFKEVALKVAKALGEKALKDFMSEVKDSRKYKKFKESLDKVESAFYKTPVGVFIKDNRTLLTVVGVGAALGIAAAMYYKREGDLVANLATKAIGSNLSKKFGDHVEVGVKGLVFKPSTRRIELTIFLTMDWKLIKSTFECELKLENGKLEEMKTKGEFFVAIADRFKLTASSMLGIKGLDSPLFYDIRLSLSYLEKHRTYSYGLSAEAFLKQEDFKRSMGAEAKLKLTWGGERFFTEFSAYYKSMEGFGPKRSAPQGDYGLTWLLGLRF